MWGKTGSFLTCPGRVAPWGVACVFSLHRQAATSNSERLWTSNRKVRTVGRVALWLAGVGLRDFPCPAGGVKNPTLGRRCIRAAIARGDRGRSEVGANARALRADALLRLACQPQPQIPIRNRLGHQTACFQLFNDELATIRRASRNARRHFFAFFAATFHDVNGLLAISDDAEEVKVTARFDAGEFGEHDLSSTLVDARSDSLSRRAAS